MPNIEKPNSNRKSKGGFKRPFKKSGNNQNKPYKKDAKDSKKKRFSRDDDNSKKRFSRDDDNNKKRFNNKDSEHKRPYRRDDNKKPVNKSKEIDDNDEINDGSVRLNRFIANSGICSRRKAEELIEAGLVSVNDLIVKDLVTRVLPTDVIKYKGEVLKGEKNVYIIMNKPKDYITSVSDPEDRKTVMDLFKGEVRERVYPVGRLDRNTTGVLLFTNDGELTKKLTHPSGNVAKIYVATLDNTVSKSDLEKLLKGFTLEDGFINADGVSYYSDSQLDRVVIEIHSGRNRIVRRMFDYLGYNVKLLDRLEFAGLTKRDLKRGQWRFLSEKEIGFLLMQAGKIKID